MINYTKGLLLVLLCTAFMQTTKAQNQVGIQISGVKSWHGSVDNQQQMIDGFNITVPMYKKITPFLYLGIEPGVAQRGSDNVNYFGFDNFLLMPALINVRIFSFFDPSNNAVSFHSNHIQLPFLAKVYAPTQNDQLKFYFKAGPGISWMASAYIEEGNFNFTENDMDDANGTIRKIEFQGDHGYNRFDFGFYGGFGIALQTGPGQLHLGTDHYIGLNAVHDYSNSKNKSLGISLSYMVQLQK